jgi:hypothetical protein
VRGVFFIGVFGFSFVFDISDETVVVISGVGHNLDTAVGKVDSVRSSEVATGILVFVLFETGSRVIIMDTVLVSERLWGEFFFFVRSGFVWCWWYGGGGPSGRAAATAMRVAKMTAFIVLRLLFLMDY